MITQKDFQELIEELNTHVEMRYRYEGFRYKGNGVYEDLEPADMAYLHITDLNPDKQGYLYELPHTSSSRLQSDLVNDANRKVILDELKEESGVWIVESDFGGQNLVVNPALLTYKGLRSLVDMLDSLADYPCLNDELYSEIELEAQQEAWDNWLSREYGIRLEEALQEYFKLDSVDIDESEELEALFWESMQDACDAFYEESEGIGFNFAYYWDYKPYGKSMIERIISLDEFTRLVESDAFEAEIEGIDFGAMFTQLPKSFDGGDQ